MVGIEFCLRSCEFGGRFMIELMFICIREHLIELESISCIDLNELIMIWCVFFGLQSQALKGDRGKQP